MRPLSSASGLSLVTAGLFAALIALPALVQLGGYRGGTAAENRVPAPWPAWPHSLAELGALPAALDAWAGDRFGLRRELIAADGWARRRLGAIGSDKVLAGKQGWLFLAKENRVLDQVQGRDRFAPAELDAWVAEMRRRAAWLRARGIGLIVTVAPNTHGIYPEFLPDWVARPPAGTRLDQLERRLAAEPDIDYVDLRSVLLRAKAEGVPLYHRTDTHWNGRGAFLAFQALHARIAARYPATVPLRAADWGVRPRRDEGDLVKMAGLSGQMGEEMLESVHLGPAPRRLQQAIPVPDRDGEEGLDLRSSLTAGPSILLYRDSFGSRLQDFFSESFPQTISLHHHWGGFDEAAIERWHPDLVVYELVERVLNVPLRATP